MSQWQQIEVPLLNSSVLLPTITISITQIVGDHENVTIDCNHHFLGFFLFLREYQTNLIHNSCYFT